MLHIPQTSAVLATDEVAATSAHFYLIGGGIASLAAAAFLIRDGHISGHHITIIEQLDRLGGSLDGTGDPQYGYLIRGGRMFESKYRCTYELFDSIPTLDNSRSVSEEIRHWNEVIRTGSKARLVRNGCKIDSPEFGLSERHILTLTRLGVEPESMLGDSTISDHFDAEFFESNFWLMWCTTFAFQPWHSAVEFKRYLLRFVHMIDGFNQLKGIMRTVYNQYDSLVRPLKKWLDQRGVRYLTGARVLDLGVAGLPGQRRISQIDCERHGQPHRIVLGPNDYAIVTLGSMTDASTSGGHDHPAPLLGKEQGSAWPLWEKLATGRPELGRPAAFADHIEQSKWLSFTVTLRDPALFAHVRDFTGNVPGEGGLITFADSNWLLSIVLPFQPHFRDQPESVQVMWGYGLNMTRPGNFVAKPMGECSGRELLTEVLGHLGVPQDQHDAIIDNATCIPCLMPFITSQFLRRAEGDRPQVMPEGWRNLALVGQFVELPEDVVFTVEYSIRSAQAAVAGLLELDTAPPPVYKGQFNPAVLARAFTVLHDMGT
ncbi:oleate hydratase [Chitinimonas lacunae]|uniref:Oleate hydratase n=1 Tax=Chitinimonas lacunae TaxID=1963018 RepID=A0ABV8MXU6_9NEIS